MQILSQFGCNRVSFDFEDQTHLAEVAFGVEVGALWYLERGVFRLRFTRKPFGSGMRLLVTPLAWPIGVGDIELSATTNLAGASMLGKLPSRLAAPWEQTPGELLFNFETDISQTLAFVVWGLSDMTVDLFKRGATVVRVQYACDVWQLAADVRLNERQLGDLLNVNTPDYLASDRVSVLPWESAR